MGKLKKKFSMFNYTKKWTSVILVFCLIWISMSYILAAFGKKEIAETLGFTDEHYFNNIFKKKRGITPGKARK